MYHFFVNPEQISNDKIVLIGPDVNHIRNVLRMKEGEEILISNGQDCDYYCIITSVFLDRIEAEIKKVDQAGTELPAKIYLFQGLPKSDKMELIIQKAVELGVYEIIPVATKRAVVKLDEKKEQSKLKRWESIAESAAKQSKRSIIPEIKSVMNIKQAVEYANDLDIRLLPYENALGIAQTRNEINAIKKGMKIGVFIGPEGGFEDGEVEFAIAHGWKAITLGKRILRTETAGLTTLSVLMFYLEQE